MIQKKLTYHLFLTLIIGLLGRISFTHAQLTFSQRQYLHQVDTLDASTYRLEVRDPQYEQALSPVKSFSDRQVTMAKKT